MFVRFFFSLISFLFFSTANAKLSHESNISTKTSKVSKSVESKTLKDTKSSPTNTDSNDLICSKIIFGTDQMRFVDSENNMVHEIQAPRKCTKFTIKLRYKGVFPSSAMGHNLVITEDKHIKEISTLSLKRGANKGYLPPSNDSRVLATSTKLLGGGAGDFKEEDIMIELNRIPKGSNISFWCSFPGHISMMKGKFLVIEPKTSQQEKPSTQKKKI